MFAMILYLYLISFIAAITGFCIYYLGNGGSLGELLLFGVIGFVVIFMIVSLFWILRKFKDKLPTFWQRAS